VGAVIGRMAHQGAVQLAAGMQGQHGMVAYMPVGARFQGVGAQHDLFDAGPAGQAGGMLAELRVDLQGAHRLPVTQGQASAQVPLACAPFQQGAAGGRAVGGEGFDLFTLALGDLPVELGSDGGQLAGWQGGELTQSFQLRGDGQPRGEPVLEGRRIAGQMLKGAVIQLQGRLGERGPLGTPGGAAFVKGRGPPQGLVGVKYGLEGEEALAERHGTGGTRMGVPPGREVRVQANTEWPCQPGTDGLSECVGRCA
jgi:hypothetical protein